ncbi:thiamine phosphate synthase [bacterium]|nr:thiamine phosphate synthase [bacterium]
MFDFSLCVILDQDWIGGKIDQSLIADIVQGGATWLQYRNKNGSDAEFVRNAEIIVEIAHRLHVPVLINDRTDIALASGADGVHVGQQDLPVRFVRTLMGPDKLIGLSVSRLEELKEIDQVNYIGIGALFETRSKPDAELSGLELVQQVRSRTELPLVGIGGITSANAANVIDAGADGVAVISSVLGAENRKYAAKEVLEAVKLSKRRNTHERL